MPAQLTVCNRAVCICLRDVRSGLRVRCLATVTLEGKNRGKN